jgi:hypothetical protein
LRSTALVSIPVGVVVERRRAKSLWADFIWRPVSVFVGKPSAEPWTVLDVQAEHVMFYAGKAIIELHRTESAFYRDNLASETPRLWVVLSPTASDPPYALLTVTADPAEGEGFTDAGNNLVDTLPMPREIVPIVNQFIAKYHVEQPFIKRRRKPAEFERQKDWQGNGT